VYVFKYFVVYINYGDLMGFPFAEERKAKKLALADIIKKNPDMELDRVVGLFSQKTGLSHTKIRMYLEELKAEGVI
jgi:hypothetical protein